MGSPTPEEAEFFPTPAWCVHRLLEAVDLPAGDWIEPAVGNGDIVTAVNAVRTDVCWTANDIRPVPYLDCYQSLLQHDFGRMVSQRSWDVGISNLPFSKALPIVRGMLQLCTHAAVLLPLAWPSAHERFDFLRAHKPDVLALPDRPWDFVRDVAWFLWPSRGLGLEILPRTLREERKRDAAALETTRYRGPEQLGLLEASS